MIVIVNNRESEKIELPEGSTVKDLADQLNLKGPEQAVAATVNGVNKDLFVELTDGDEVSLWNFSDPEGQEVFWHTSAHVLAQAVLRLWPEAQPTIGPPIENGFYYDFANLHISDADFDKIEKEMKAIVKENYKAKREDLGSKEEAIARFGDNPYKKELIESFDPDAPLSGYHQGEFFDLCRGPHLYQLGKIKALKVMKLSGAYWRGDSDNEMLTRIYGVTFPDKKQLKEYLHRLEEAKKRDHKVVGPKLDLFSMKEEAPGMPLIHPKGMIIWTELEKYIRECISEADYVEIKTPILMVRELWEKSGHWENYRDNMFTTEIGERPFALKPMNCPGGMLFYKTHIHSYRELPLRVAEIGNVHRHEPSGALSGLCRVQCFHQDDAHIYMEPKQIQDEVLKTIQLTDKVYQTFGLDYHLELSTRPEENTIGSDEEWEQATEGLRGALEACGKEYRINEGDGAFYGPKIDFHIYDAIGRTWQCATIQLDMSLPRRFDLEYSAADGTRKRPVMIHRTIYGSIERFLGILIEHFAGKFPLWISPLQVRLVIVADRHADYAYDLKKKFRKAGFHCDVDDSHESVSKKIRNAQLTQINYILTIGDKEVENKTVNLRTRDNTVHGEVEIDAFIEAIKTEKEERSLTSPYEKKEG